MTDIDATTLELEPYPWLESDEKFEGVGAHRDNPRYDPVDEDVAAD